MRENRKNKKKTGMKVLVTILVILIIAAGILLGLKYYQDKQKADEAISLGTDVIKEEKEPVKEINIFKGNERPIAVMIDNHKGALPQAGLNDAYMVYEIIVEGGESRLMALFKGANLEKIGPVRSSRHYFLDYALENDAIYVHYGWSPQAQSDISKLSVNNINGITESEKSFWRVKDKSAPHNVATSTKDILKIAEKKGYRTASTNQSVLHYVADPVTMENGKVASTVVIPYSDSNIAKYTYDTETKRYVRYDKGIKEKDWVTGELVTTKNIIITFAKNSVLNDGENKDRQTLTNVTKAKGYYITNGKAIEITCEKDSRKAKTIYKDLQGNEINVNDGNTFVQICPIDAKVEISE